MTQTHEKKSEAKRLLNKLYKDVWAFTIPKHDDLAIRETKSSSLYGEITFGGVEALINYLRLGEDDVFVDLGSGVGKVVMQIAMTSSVKKVIGVELSGTRYKDALGVLSKASELGLVDANRCEFRNENILETDLDNASVIYTCSTAFPSNFMDKLTEKITKHPKGRVVSLQDLPSHPRLELVDRLKLNMSWAKNQDVHVYHLIN
jgi:tRNA G46 methylase TrmB